jgi:hypothetical protein
MQYNAWIGVWQALADMKGLWYLRIELQVNKKYWRNIPAEEEEILLKPIMSVKAHQFDLILPFPGKPGDSAWTALPCRITRVIERWA